jgi:hypothetical protein
LSTSFLKINICSKSLNNSHITPEIYVEPLNTNLKNIEEIYFGNPSKIKVF